MATPMGIGNLSNTLMQKLDSELICGVCLELFNRPIMLPCSHNFCQQCILGVIETGMSFSFISIGPPRSFNCPICQAVISMSKFSVDGPVVNTALQNIVDLYKSCAPVDIFDSAWNIDLEVTPTMCEEHERPRDRFCDSCSVTVCSHCERNKHQSSKAKHRVESLKHATVSYQTEIADILTDLKKKLIPLNDRVHHLEDILRADQGNQESTGKKLEQSMSALMSHLRERQEDLKQKLENDMVERHRPITRELERCRGIKTNVHELMKKLSQVRLTQNPTLKLKLMKDTCKQLMTVLCFDVDQCLQTPGVIDTSVPVWNLNVQEMITAVNNLSWEQNQPGAARGRCEETQTESADSENLDIPQPRHSDTIIQANGGTQCNTKTNSKHNNEKHSPWLNDHMEALEGSPEKTTSGNRSFDEIDGDYINNHTNGVTARFDVENERPVVAVTKNKLDIKMKDLKQNGLSERKQNVIPSTDDNDNNGDLNLKLERPVTTLGHKSKGRSSFPMENTPICENKNVNGKPKILVNRAKKSHSDKELNRRDGSYSPSNAEVLAKFVARRRTISPSKSSPTLKGLDDTLNNTSLRDEIDFSRNKQSSSHSLQSLGESFEKFNSQQNKDFVQSFPAFRPEKGLLPEKDNIQSHNTARSFSVLEDSGTSLTERGKHSSTIAKPLDRNDTLTDIVITAEIDSTTSENTHIRLANNKSETDKTKTDTAKTDKTKTDTAKTDKAKTDAAKTDKAKTDKVKTDIKKTQTDDKNCKTDIFTSILVPDTVNTKLDIRKVTSRAGLLKEQPVSQHQKTFSKQPIGGNLNFDLGLDDPAGECGAKKITQV